MRNIGKGSKALRRNSPILLISTLLVLSAIVRLGSEAGAAIAEATERNEEANMFQEADQEPRIGFDRTETPAGRPNESMGVLLEKLRTRERQLAAREAQMVDREKILKLTTTEVERRILNLENMEKKLRRTLSLSEGAAEEDLTQLTAVYEKMKPKDAAMLFESMDSPFAAGFLGRMKPEIAAAIMTGLTPDKAYAVSAILAGRNLNTPEN